MNFDQYLDYDEQIKQADDIDVMVIDLGWDGYFCSNCPRCTPSDSYTYKIPFPKKQLENPTYKDRP